MWLATSLLGPAPVSMIVRRAAAAAAAASPFAERADGQAALLLSGPSIELASPQYLLSASSWPSACSFSHPICVHPSPGTPDFETAAVLPSVDRAWETIVGILGAPPPDAGLDGRWSVFLIGGVEGGGTALPDTRDAMARFDRVSSYALVDRALPPGCELDLATARAVARGALWAAAPATDQGSAFAQTEMLARLAAPCAGRELEALEFQAHPERALVDAMSTRFARGAGLFFDWLDKRFGNEPAALLVGLWALAPTETPAGATHWSRSPTAFDVLGVSLNGVLWDHSTLDDVFLRFAVARGTTLPLPRTAWRLPWPLRPRRIVSPEPLSPTGATYVLIDRAGAPPGARLRLEMEWEDYARIRWIVVKLDGAGRTLGELSVTSLDNATRASTTIESLDAVDRVMLVGVGLPPGRGSFDPDQGEWEPHGWLLTLRSE